MRDFESEKQQREYLATWGQPVPPEAGDVVLSDFEAQCQAMITVAPKASLRLWASTPRPLSRN